MWDIATGKWMRLGGDDLPVIRPIAFSPDGKLIAVGDANDWTTTPNKIRLFDGKTGKPTVEFPGHTGGIWALTFSADGKLLASADAAGPVKSWQRGARSAGPGLVAGRLGQLLDQLVKRPPGGAPEIEGPFHPPPGPFPPDAEV